MLCLLTRQGTLVFSRFLHSCTPGRFILSRVPTQLQVNKEGEGADTVTLNCSSRLEHFNSSHCTQHSSLHFVT